LTELFVTAGIACLVGAVVGGGLTLFGAKLPFVTVGRQVLLAVLGAGLLLFGITQNGGGQPDEPNPTGPMTDAPTTTEPTDGPTTSGGDLVSDGPWSNTVGGLTLVVDRVVRKGDGSLEIDATVDNQTGDAISLPLFGNLVAGDDLGGSYEADAFGSDWPETFPTGRVTSGTIRIDQPVSREATTLSIDFGRVFGTFDVDSIGVVGIELP
jgi:hypothetical protein